MNEIDEMYERFLATCGGWVRASREVFEAGVRAENEACAKLVEEQFAAGSIGAAAFKNCAEAIRNRHPRPAAEPDPDASAVLVRLTRMVGWFSAIMLDKLNRNAGKGILWREDSEASLLLRVEDEMRELQDAMSSDDGGKRGLERIVDECADAANFLMMIADRRVDRVDADPPMPTDDWRCPQCGRDSLLCYARNDGLNVRCAGDDRCGYSGLVPWSRLKIVRDS